MSALSGNTVTRFRGALDRLDRASAAHEGALAKQRKARRALKRAEHAYRHALYISLASGEEIRNTFVEAARAKASSDHLEDLLAPTLERMVAARVALTDAITAWLEARDTYWSDGVDLSNATANKEHLPPFPSFADVARVACARAGLAAEILARTVTSVPVSALEREGDAEQ